MRVVVPGVVMAVVRVVMRTSSALSERLRISELGSL